jgi:hypothetical protein
MPERIQCLSPAADISYPDICLIYLMYLHLLYFFLGKADSRRSCRQRYQDNKADKHFMMPVSFRNTETAF